MAREVAFTLASIECEVAFAVVSIECEVALYGKHRA